MRDFDVESITICDYATLDVAGKSVLVGVYASEVRFVVPPPFWFPLFLVAVLDPVKREFGFQIEFVRPDGRILSSITGRYVAPTDPPLENRAIINWQIPAMRFTGAGKYVLRAKDQSGVVVFERDVTVAVGPPTAPFSAQISADVVFDAEL